MATTPRKYFERKTQLKPYNPAKFNAQDAEALVEGLIDHDTQLEALTEVVNDLPANVNGVFDRSAMPDYDPALDDNGLFARLDSWALSRGLPITIPVS
ncbi:MAG: hypothetical protein ACRYG7_13220 [Janthinobacterium lividum]